ncbi:hypothetical protein CLU79DRAFT_764047 [Phycomyces nitens]|nr:hypothetical protein CLU79DRAFT_764047 [Phycomyces nitens]
MLLLFQSGQLQDSNHKEGWFQGHVYADLFDAVFMFDPYYVTKRTECHAATIKYLKKAKKKEAIYKVVLHNSVNFLVSSLEGVADNLIFREDSPLSSSSDNQSATSSSQSEDKLMEMEQARRVVKLIDDKINNMTFEDEIITCKDWEDILCINKK